MAMTICPNCSEQISDKAKKCVHCGTVLVLQEKKYCADCGVELEEEMETCPKCGCPYSCGNLIKKVWYNIV